MSLPSEKSKMFHQERMDRLERQPLSAPGVTDTPQLVVVGGPNGCGKTTFARHYAKAESLPYLGADDIAFALAPLDPASVRVRAGREFSLRLDADCGQPFAGNRIDPCGGQPVAYYCGGTLCWLRGDADSGVSGFR